MSPEAKGTKANINKQIETKLKRFFTIKETISKMKRQTTEWEKRFVSNISYNGIHIQNIQRTYTTQHKKKQKSVLKNGQI